MASELRVCYEISNPTFFKSFQKFGYDFDTIKEIAENKSAGVVNVNSSIELSKLSNNYHPKKEIVDENIPSIFR